MDHKPVTVYSKPTCPHCTATKELLSTKGVSFTVLDVVADPSHKDTLVSLGLKTVPQIYIDGVLLPGGNSALQAAESDGVLDTLLYGTASTSSSSSATSTSSTTSTASDSDWGTDDEEDSIELPSVSTPALYVIHDNDEWHKPFAAALEEAGVPVVVWRVGAAGSLDLSSTPPEGVFFVRTSASSHTRGKRWAMEQTLSIVHWLEAHSRHIIGTSDNIALEVSKIKQTIELQRLGVPTPAAQAVVGDSPKRIVSAIRRMFKTSPDGVIVKPNRGGSGSGVRLVRSMEHAKALAKAGGFEGSLDGSWIVQQYIPSPEKALYRLEFIGGRYVYALRVDTAAVTEATAFDAELGNCPLTDLNNCPADACDLEDEDEDDSASASASASDAAPTPSTSSSKFTVLPHFTHSIIPKIEAFLADLNIHIAGIEIVMDASGEAYVIDANVVNSNLNTAAEQRAGLEVSGTSRVARFLAGELSSVTSGFPRVSSVSSVLTVSTVSSEEVEAEAEAERVLCMSTRASCSAAPLASPTTAGLVL